MTWEDPDDAKQERYVRAMLENEKRSLLLASTVRLMETILRTKTCSIDEARLTSIMQISLIAQEIYGIEE